MKQINFNAKLNKNEKNGNFGTRWDAWYHTNIKCSDHINIILS